MYKVKTSNLFPFLSKMHISKKQDHLEDFESDIDSLALIKPEFSCGSKVQAVRDSCSMQMETMTCGNQNISPETNELVDACHAEFENPSPYETLMIEQMQEYVENRPLNLFGRCKKFAKDHPYLTVAAIAFPVVCGLIGYGAKAALPTTAKITANNQNTTAPVPTNATAASTTSATTSLATTTVPTTTSTITSTAPSTTVTTVPPEHSVSISKDKKGNEVVSVITREEVTTKEEAKPSCFTTKLHTDHLATTSEIEVNNKCANPIVVSQQGSKKSCVVEPNTVRGCVGEKHKKFYYSKGSNVVFIPATKANQTLSTKLMANGDVVVNLASPPAPLTQKSCMQPLAVDGSKAYSNNCNKPVAFSMTKYGRTKTVLVKPKQNEFLEYAYQAPSVTLGENVDLPVIEQSARFELSPKPLPTAPTATIATIAPIAPTAPAVKPTQEPRLRTLSVQKNASGKDVVTVLTREKIAPKSKNTTSCLTQNFSANNQTGEINSFINNDCTKPVLITPKGGDTPISIVLPKQKNSGPYSSSEFDFYLGSNIGFLPSTGQQKKIEAHLMTNNDVLVELTSRTTPLNCIKNIGTDASQNNAPRYNNTCNEPVLLNMRGADNFIHNEYFEAHEAKSLPSNQRYTPVGENKNIPTIVQKPRDLRDTH